MEKRIKRTFFVSSLWMSCMVLAMDATLYNGLTLGFYDSTCPFVEDIVRWGVHKAVEKEGRMAASLLRLHFHDCFVNGCDGSILLDDVKGRFVGEKTAFPNFKSVRGYEVIDEIKSDLESSCKGIVSCSDILAIAARDSVVLSGGPSWDVYLGRRDSLTADKNAANQRLPGPGMTVSQLVFSFQAVGLSAQDLPALSGAHTIGAARCLLFRNRFLNQSSSGSSSSDSHINPTYRNSVQQLCKGSQNDNTLGSLDPSTPMDFDNNYFSNLQQGVALLGSDQALYGSNNHANADVSKTRTLVEIYSNDQEWFFEDFVTSMQRMGNLSPLVGEKGEIRQNCRYVNS